MPVRERGSRYRSSDSYFGGIDGRLLLLFAFCTGLSVGVLLMSMGQTESSGCGDFHLRCYEETQSFPSLSAASVEESLENNGDSEVLSDANSGIDDDYDYSAPIPGDSPNTATTTVANEMVSRVSIFCMIMTLGKDHETKAAHVKATWAQHCNEYLFISSEEDPSLPSVNLDTPDATLGRLYLFEKTKAAFTYLYVNNYLGKFDWFLKTDDDAYVVIDNLRFMLMLHDPEDLVYYGGRWKGSANDSFMHGGPGYVLSRAAVAKLVEQGLNDTIICKPYWGGGNEDQFMGYCMEHLGGVKWVAARDAKLRHLILPTMPDWLLNPENMQGDYWMNDLMQYSYYPMTPGEECCSDYVISFHIISPPMMYLLEFFTYRFRHHYGIGAAASERRIPTQKLAKRLQHVYSTALTIAYTASDSMPSSGEVSDSKKLLPAYLLDTLHKEHHSVKSHRKKDRVKKIHPPN